MPCTPSLTDAVFLSRYAAPGEATRPDTYKRVAAALAAREKGADRHRCTALFLAHFLKGAIGAGRIMANAGRDGDATMVNCFVQPALDPSLGWPHGVDAAMARAIRTMVMGGGVGYDFTPIPPAAAAGGGVCDVIDRYDRVCRNQHALVGRPAAQMGVLACDHPDILDFITAKEARRRWPTFNLSVAVTDAFMKAVEEDELWALSHGAAPFPASRPAPLPRDETGRWRYGVLPARHLWQVLTDSACRSSEPGVIFIDRVNDANNLRAIEHLGATNPCGEQPLPPYGSCVLGPINVSALVRDPFGAGAVPSFDFGELAARVHVQVRMLDNVLDLTRWPLEQHAAEAKAKRRIGVGITGLADALAMMGVRYDSQAGRDLAAAIAQCMRDHAYLASAELAAERGAYPMFRQEAYLDSARVSTHPPFPPRVLDAIRKHGLRNSHLLSFAPAGSVSLAFFDNCSSGVEPPHAWRISRHLRLPSGETTLVEAQNAAWRLWRHLKGKDGPLPRCLQTASDVSPSAHVEMMAALQPWVDAAISKTVPIPTACRAEEVSLLLFQAWRSGLKGLTVFRPDPSLPAAIETACAKTPRAAGMEGARPQPARAAGTGQEALTAGTPARAACATSIDTGPGGSNMDLRDRASRP